MSCSLVMGKAMAIASCTAILLTSTSKVTTYKTQPQILTKIAVGAMGIHYYQMVKRQKSVESAAWPLHTCPIVLHHVPAPTIFSGSCWRFRMWSQETISSSQALISDWREADSEVMIASTTFGIYRKGEGGVISLQCALSLYAIGSRRLTCPPGVSMVAPPHSKHLTLVKYS